MTKNNYKTAPVPRGRGTVIDLLSVISSKAKPGHLICDIDLSWVSSERKTLLLSGSRVTITAFIMKAIGIAQRDNPQSRTEVLPWGKRVTYNNIVAGFTVERDVDHKDTVFFAEVSEPDSKSLSELASEIKTYSQNQIGEIAPLKKQLLFSGLPTILRRFMLSIATRIPAARLSFQRSTFGLTSLGKYGISSVLSPCICTSTFTVGSQEDRVVAIKGDIFIKPMVTLVLSFDQRVMDPSLASRFLNEVKELLEGGMSSHITGDSRLPAVSGAIR